MNILTPEVASPDANLRRFVAESLGPVQENKWFYKDPAYPLSILRNMYKEPSPYPRTSVGNLLSDLARRLPDAIYDFVGELVEAAMRTRTGSRIALAEIWSRWILSS